MSCCGVKIQARRNGDLRVTYSPSSRKFTFSGLVPTLTIRNGDTVLLSVTESATENGSTFVVVGDSFVLTITKEDIAILDSGDPDTTSEILSYDVVAMDTAGFENWLLGGPFIVLGLNDQSCGESCGDIEVSLDGQCVQVSIEAGNIGVGASISLAALNEAVVEAEASAADAEAAAIQAQAAVASIPGMIAGKADVTGGNLTGTEPDEFRAAINGASRDLSDVTEPNYLAFRDGRFYLTLDPADPTGSANGTKFAASIAAAQDKELTLTQGNYRLRFAANVTGLAQLNLYGVTLDFSARPSAGSCLAAAGTLSPTLVTLAANGVKDATTISLSANTGIVANAWLLISSDQRDYIYSTNPLRADESQKYGEQVQVRSISGSGPYTVVLKTALRFPYTTAENAKVQVINVGKAPVIKGGTIIGSGQTYSNGAQNSGDYGVAWTWCDKAIAEDVTVINCNRNGFRLVNTRIGDINKWSAEFQPQLTNAEIQYGVSIIGAYDKISVRNGECRGGRHGIDTVGGDGFGFSLTTFNNTIRDTYSSAIGEHSGLRWAHYDHDTIISCGGGFSIRGRGRKVTSPTIVNCYNAATNGEAFVFSDYAGDITIIDPTVDNVRYVAFSETSSFAANQALGRVTWIGGSYKKYQSGIVLRNVGGENVEFPGTYNTTIAGPFVFRSLNMLSSYPDEIASTASPIEVSGYVKDFDAQGCRFEFDTGTTPSYPLLIRGVERIVAKGNTCANTMAIAAVANAGGTGVIDNTGATVTRNPLYVDVRENTYLGIVTDTVPVFTGLTAATTKFTVRGNTASNINFSEPIPGGVAVALTIAAGVITLPPYGCSSVTIDTEALAATDDLDTINGGVEGDILTVRTTNNARDITLKRLTGNLVPGIADLVLTNVLDQTTFRKNNANQWIAIADINNG